MYGPYCINDEESFNPEIIGLKKKIKELEEKLELVLYELDLSIIDVPEHKEVMKGNKKLKKRVK